MLEIEAIKPWLCRESCCVWSLHDAANTNGARERNRIYGSHGTSMYVCMPSKGDVRKRACAFNRVRIYK